MGLSSGCNTGWACSKAATTSSVFLDRDNRQQQTHRQEQKKFIFTSGRHKDRALKSGPCDFGENRYFNQGLSLRNGFCFVKTTCGT
jgi:hypothetical protein